MKKFAKILSILCALALIASCVSVGFVASAAEAVWSSSNTAGGYPSENLFKNAKIVISGVASDTNVVVSKYSVADKFMSANAASGDNFLPGFDNLTAENDSSNDVKQTAAYIQWTWDLNGSVSQPEKFIYTAHNNTGAVGQYISVHYELFASENLYDLYDASNSVYLHSASQGAGVQHVIDISALDLPKVKFFGARFYDRPFSSKSMHAAELGLYGGTYTASGVVYSEKFDIPAADTTYPAGNHLTDGVITFVANGGAAGTANILSNFYDGVPTGGYKDFGFPKAKNTPFQTDNYFQVEYTLASAINNPEKFLYAPGTGWVNMASNRYTVFASSSKDTLYNDESIVYEYITNYGSTGNNQTPAQPMEQWLDLTNANLKNIKYFAIRFYHRSYPESFAEGGSMNFISEIGLYGGKSVFQGNPEPTSDDYATRFGDNWLTTSSFVSTESVDGVEGTPKSVISSAAVDNLWSTGRGMYQSANGMNADNNEAGQTDTYFQTTFTLAAAVNNPETALIAWGNSNGKEPDLQSYESLHYEIFASDKLADLYTKSVYEHNVSSKVGWEHVIDISDQKLTGVKYFGIRIYNRPTELWNSIVVVTEIGLYGGEKEATVNLNVKNSAFDNYSAYGSNRLASATGVATVVMGEEKALAEESRYFVDGGIVTSTTAFLQASGDAIGSVDNSETQTENYFQLTYALSAAIDSPEMILFSPYWKAENHGSKHYAVYAGSDRATLFDKPVYEYNGNGSYTAHEIDISELNLQDIKYVAFRFYHRNYGGKYQFVSEVGLFGGTVDGTLVPSNISIEANMKATTNFLADKAIVSSVANNGAGSIVDYYDKETFVHFTNGDVSGNGGEGAKWASEFGANGYLRVAYELAGTLDNPTSFTIQAGWGLSKGYAVYVSDSLDNLYDEGNKVVYIDGYSDLSVAKRAIAKVEDLNLTGIRYIGLHMNAVGNVIQATEFSVEGGTYTEDPKEPEVSISLGASVFASTAGQNANDITYKVNVTSDSTIVDMGIISGFKVNIDADAAFGGDYAEYLKTAPETAIKVSATAEQITNPELYFHVTNSGKAGNADYSGYKLVTIAYVTVEFEGETYTYYSNVIAKSSKQISRNQAKNYKEAGYVIEGYEGYAFTTDATIDIAKVREYVEAVNAMKAQ